MKRVLFISYAFPPVGGAGVQRIAKFAKYLPACNWAVSVLTAANPSVPLFDESLCADIPPETVIERAPTWEPSYAMKSSVTAASVRARRGSLLSPIKAVARSAANAVLQPDPQILWAPGAIKHGKRLLRRLHHDVIVASGPPFSSFIIGAYLSRLFRIPLVLDYRDEWDISNAHWENRRYRRLGRHMQSWLQAKLLRSAQAVLATTLQSAQRIASRAGQFNATAAVRHVYNGYDPEDFPAEIPAVERSDVFRITYTGTLWKLTSIEPLVSALEKINKAQPEIAKRIELVVAGRRTQEQEAILDRLDSTHTKLVRRDYLPHKEAIQLLHDSDLLCVLLSDTPDAARVVPAKVFEYMACRRPVLAIAPAGELWELLRGHPRTLLLAPGPTARIAEALVKAVGHPPQPVQAAAYQSVSAYSRPAQSGQLANVLDALTISRPESKHAYLGNLISEST
jgi:glycosyltransferase involved in cell wall biosynthesis